MEPQNNAFPEIPLSAIQHWNLCPRRCFLIHVVGIWEENQLTAEGRILHEHIHQSGNDYRAGVTIARGLHLTSRRLGLTGQADAVQFQKGEPPFPVEYKRGKPKDTAPYELQLCAQAMCLEEMLGVEIPKGALYFGASRKRQDIPFTSSRRKEVELSVMGIRKLLLTEQKPPILNTSPCKSCSLKQYCVPSPHSVQDYLQEALTEC